MKTKTVVLGLILMAGTTVSAQSKVECNFHIAPPMWDFKQGTYDDFSSKGSVSVGDPKGFAGTGLGLGFEYHKPLGTKGLNLKIGIDAYYHRVKRIVRQSFIADISVFGGESIRFSQYYNIPISMGIHFQRDVKEDIALYGQFSGLYNLLKISKSVYMENTGSNLKTWENSYGLSQSFGYGYSVGMIVDDKYVLGIGYTNLGSHLINRTYSYKGATDSKTYVTQNQKNIPILNLNVGIIL